jgi:hypothetical protein
VSGLRSCPRCAETIKRAAQVCRHCGSDIPIELTEEVVSEPVVETRRADVADLASDESVDVVRNAKDWTWS